MNPPKLIFASDSFKGTISSARTAELLAQAAAETLPGATYRAILMADGGEGTEEALVSACGGTRRTLLVHDPSLEALERGKRHEASFGMLPDGTAIIEMAQGAGITLLAGSLDPRTASTYGVGELIRAALDEGSTGIVLTLGGSATNDGGMGMMQALGVRFLDETGTELPGCGASLARVRHIDRTGLDPRVATTRFAAMCDVDNPLTGPNGATRTFGPQKAVDLEPALAAQVLDELEAGMCQYERVLERTFGQKIGLVPGAGAAGGLGAASLAFLKAQLQYGIDTVLSLVGFDQLLDDADLCITGEGRLDAQTARGKVVSGIAACCAKHGVPCVAIAGSIEAGAERIPGLTAAMPLALGPCSLDDCLDHAEELFLLAAHRVFSLYAAGRSRA